MNGLEDYIAPFVYGGPEFRSTLHIAGVRGNEGVGNPYKYTGDLGLTAGGGVELWRRWRSVVAVHMGYDLSAQDPSSVMTSVPRGRQWACGWPIFFWK